MSEQSKEAKRLHDERYGQLRTVTYVKVEKHIDHRIRDNNKINNDHTKPAIIIRHRKMCNNDLKPK